MQLTHSLTPSMVLFKMLICGLLSFQILKSFLQAIFIFYFLNKERFKLGFSVQLPLLFSSFKNKRLIVMQQTGNNITF